MKSNKIVFLLFFLFLSFNLQARSNLNIEEATTRKGFKFLLAENHDLPKVSLNISFKDAGYAYEDSEKQGLSWFTALIMQEGAGENDAEAFAEKLKSKGISLAFYPSIEAFTVSLDTLSENLEESIKLLSDAIMRPRVDSEGLKRVLESIKVSFGHLATNPHFIASKEIGELLFKKHPYSKNLFGTLDTVTNITRDDILTYIKDNFAKDNIVISVVGDITKEEVADLLDQYLSELPAKRSKVEKVPVKNDFKPAETKSIFMDIPQSVIFFAQTGVDYNDPDYYNAIILINALGGMGLNSILTKELRQNLGITYGISALLVNNKHGNVVAGSIGTDTSTAKQAISAIKNTFETVKNQGIDEQLFKDTKLNLINGFTFSLAQNKTVANMLDLMQANDRDIDRLNRFTDIINNVKLEEVNRVAGYLLDPENLFFVEVGKNAQSK